MIIFYNVSMGAEEHFAQEVSQLKNTWDSSTIQDEKCLDTPNLEEQDDTRIGFLISKLLLLLYFAPEVN